MITAGEGVCLASKVVSLSRRMNLMRGLPRAQVTFTKSIPGLRPAGQPSAVPIRSRRIGLARPRESNQRGRSCASRQLLPALLYLPPSMAVACARDIRTSMYVKAAAPARCAGCTSAAKHRDVRERPSRHFRAVRATREAKKLPRSNMHSLTPEMTAMLGCVRLRLG